MPLAKNVEYIVIHCSAGFSGVEQIKKYWETVLGWNAPGYHIIIDLDGKAHVLADFNRVTNGVRGFNSKCIHICYIGGVKVDNYLNYIKDENGRFISEDTRTDEQKRAIHVAIQDSIAWLAANGKDITKKLSVVGHRDFSKDLNNDGIISPYERIKDCPSFDAMKQYGGLYNSTDRYGKLPHVA